jgi:chromosome partitioning protein
MSRKATRQHHPGGHRAGGQARAGATAAAETKFSAAPARVVAVCNQKGGCGKTTSVINIAAGLASLGKRVLVVDLDSQCNATSGLGYSPSEPGLSTFDAMVRTADVSIKEVIQETEYQNLHLAPGSIELSEFESRVASEIGRENKLKKALAPILHDFDIILLDTPPSLGLISVNALNAASEVQIAMQAHPFALDGMNLLLETIDLIREELNPNLAITGVYITMFDGRTNISRHVMSEVEKIPALKGRIFKSIIRQNVKVTEATQARVPVMYYDMFSTGTQDYISLAEEIAKQKGLGARLSKSNKSRSNSKAVEAQCE